MTENVLLVENRGAVRVLTMNRPDKLNALNGALTQALHDELLAAERAEEIGAIVLTGAGRAFCAGADVGEFKHLTTENPEDVYSRAELTKSVHALFPVLSKPVIAAARGHAAGGGAGYAMACDLVVASETFILSYPELKHDIVAAVVMSNLVRQLGRKRAFELVAMGRRLTAPEALDWGVVNKVVPDDALLDEAMAMAEKLASVARPAMRATKGLFYRVAETPFHQALDIGRDVNIAMRSFRKSKEG